MTAGLPDPQERPPGVPRGAVWFPPDDDFAALRLFERSCPRNWGALRVLGVPASGLWAWTTEQVSS
jgi:hypothetical protein